VVSYQIATSSTLPLNNLCPVVAPPIAYFLPAPRVCKSSVCTVPVQLKVSKFPFK